jgi:tetratricopeptide (TPR) repeat protein
MAIQKSFNTFPTLFLLMVFLITSCEEYLSDDSFLSTEADSYSGFITSGWAAFSVGEYDDALVAFQSAAERDATQPEVYLGLGWSQLRLMNAVNAGSNFQKVISFAFLDETNSTQLLNHAHAGLTFLELVNANYESVISFGSKVISSDSNYEFDKDNTINMVSVLNTMAEAHYYLNQISDAFEISVGLGENFSTVINTNDIATVSRHYDNSSIDGMVNATVSKGAHLLISVESATVYGLNCSIAEIYEGTNGFDIIRNPVPAIGDTVIVDYAYTTDYADFLVELISNITE